MSRYGRRADNSDFPLPEPEIAFGFLHGLVWMAYGNIRQRIAGVAELIGATMK